MAETICRVDCRLPFYTQMVTEETWRDEGYASFEEGLDWSKRSCGIASVRMVVDGIRAQRGLPVCGTQAAVLRLGLELDAYKPGVGWIHQGLTDIAAAFGVSGEARRGGTAAEVFREIGAGRPCIVSVTPRFAPGEPDLNGVPYGRGGHLAAVWGAALEGGELAGFWVHHPSCFPESNWPDLRVALDRFQASFSGNFIVFQP